MHAHAGDQTAHEDGVNARFSQHFQQLRVGRGTPRRLGHDMLAFSGLGERFPLVGGLHDGGNTALMQARKLLQPGRLVKGIVGAHPNEALDSLVTTVLHQAGNARGKVCKVLSDRGAFAPVFLKKRR